MIRSRFSIMSNYTQDTVEAIHLLARHGGSASREALRRRHVAVEGNDMQAARRWARVEALISRP